MARTIHQLLVAQAAGESLSDADLEQLRCHQRETFEAFAALHRWIPMPWDHAPEFQHIRERITRKLDGWDAAELREIVRLLLSVIQFGDDFIAQAEGRWRREQREKRQSAQLSGEARRTAASAFATCIDVIKTDNPTLTDAAAVRRHLRDTDADWLTLADTERTRRLTAAIRRLGRARKKTGHEQR